MKGDYKKATQAINYLAKKSVNNIVNDLKAIKLIWIADRYHLRKYGRPVISDQYYAMPRGPVCSIALDIADKSAALSEVESNYANSYLSNLTIYEIKSIKDVDMDVFSETDIEALEFACDNFHVFQKFDLVNMTHLYPEWSKHEYLINAGSRRVDMDYVDFFDDPKDLIGDKFKSDPEILKIAKEIFLESQEDDKRWIGVQGM